MRTPLLALGRHTNINIEAAAARRELATRQVSSGLRVEKPSDSPGEASAVVRTNSEIARLQQLEKNLGAARAELRAVDGALFDVVDALHRGVTLAAQAATDTTDASGRETIGVELEGIKRHVLTVANTVFAGRYLFGGSLDSTPPFQEDPTGVVSYSGDSVGRSIRFPDGQPEAISLPGDAVFLTPGELTGSGRTAHSSGAALAVPIGLGVTFEGDVHATISADLTGFFVASSPPSGATNGDQVSVTLTSDDGLIVESVSVTLAGGENASAIAGLLNTEIASNPQLAGNFTFSDEGGALTLTQADTLDQGFTFTSSSVGSVVTGLEAGGDIGGYSAGEIAAALNAQVALNSDLTGAGVTFTAVNGEVVVDSDVDVIATFADFDRGTSFQSGLEGRHRIGGANSADVFGTFSRLLAAITANDQQAIAAEVRELQVAVDHVSRSQGFYGGALRQVEASLETLERLDVVSQDRLSSLRDADIVEAIGEFQSASTAEELAIQIAGRQRPNLLDVLG